MTKSKIVKCPHCGYEFTIDFKKETEKKKTVSIKFMGIAKSIGPRAKSIAVTCKNRACRRSFHIKP